MKTKRKGTLRQTEYVIGADFGTDSVRSVVIRTKDGKEIGSAVSPYPRWRLGKFCNAAANQFRQHPLDYVESFESSIKGALKQCPKGIAKSVVGISVDTTGSTPVAVDRNGTPLALTKGFERNPNAMFVLWKDHTAVQEAEEINSLARSWGGEDYTKFEGGVYSSEWFWAKILHVLRSDRSIREAAYSWVEHCDWFPALLTGTTSPATLKRSRCAAGHKAMWHPSFGGLPPEEFLIRLDPLLHGLRARLYTDTYTSDTAAGTLSPEWARRLGLTTDVVVGVGAFDAHMGAIGGEIAPYHLTKIMGTSTCDILIAPRADVGEKLVKGICGQVDGSVIPGTIGMEAGQSAFGDVYAWFKDLLMWPLEHMIKKSKSLTQSEKGKIIEELSENIIAELSHAARKVPIDESGVLALDWMNGRRTPDANQLLKGAITGISLGTDAPRIFRALVEATAFGARKIVERFRSEGVRIDGIIAFGGVAKKSPFIMQTVADVLGMNIRIPRSEQTCALGAAMCAATVAGVYSSIDQAKNAMGSGFEKEYLPNKENVRKYARVFERYCSLGDFIERDILERKVRL
jgi:L-ribulokinase